MRGIKRLVFVVGCVAVFTQAYSQRDTAWYLAEVEISAPKPKIFQTGFRTTSIDSSYIFTHAFSSLADILSQQSSVFVKNYGPGSLATLSLRGGNASQTPVLWNGINISNPMLGQMDLSLFPAILADHISISYGGNAALDGYNSVSGAINISDRIDQQRTGLTILTQAGQFGKLDVGLKAVYNMGKVGFKTTLYNQYAKNNFPFTNYFLPDSPTQKMQNAVSKSKGVQQSITLPLRAGESINASVWYQDTRKQLPPTLTDLDNSEIQSDRDFRSQVRYTRNIRHISYGGALAYFNSRMNYKDEITGIDALHVCHTVFSEAYLGSVQNRFWNWRAGLQYTYQQGVSDALEANPVQHRPSVYINNGFDLFSSKLNVTAHLRTEYVSKEEVPVSGTLGLQYNINKTLNLFGHVARTYRVPTINDRYWEELGNPDLKSEKGWNEELGIGYNPDESSFKAHLSIFNAQVFDQIIWLPDKGLWRPRNVQQVWSRGVQLSGREQVLLNKMALIFSVDASHTLSTNRETVTANDDTYGKQLIYVPKWQIKARAGLRTGQFTTSVACSFFGKRYISSSNDQYLDPYTLLDFSMGYTFRTGRSRLYMGLDINNLFNTEYQSIVNRPMPGIQFLLNLKFDIPFNR